MCVRVTAKNPRNRAACRDKWNAPSRPPISTARLLNDPSVKPSRFSARILHALFDTSRGARKMLPQSVRCEECGATASVRGCGRIEYDWPKTPSPGRTTAIPTVTFARLTIDCPNCGVRHQDLYLLDRQAKAPRQRVAARRRDPSAPSTSTTRQRPR